MYSANENAWNHKLDAVVCTDNVGSLQDACAKRQLMRSQLPAITCQTTAQWQLLEGDELTMLCPAGCSNTAAKGGCHATAG